MDIDIRNTSVQYNKSRNDVMNNLLTFRLNYKTFLNFHVNVILLPYLNSCV